MVQIEKLWKEWKYIEEFKRYCKTYIPYMVQIEKLWKEWKYIEEFNRYCKTYIPYMVQNRKTMEGMEVHRRI